mgnify:CR=1 FL=1
MLAAAQAKVRAGGAMHLVCCHFVCSPIQPLLWCLCHARIACLTHLLLNFIVMWPCPLCSFLLLHAAAILLPFVVTRI